jgi:hypothetical protein
MIRASVIALSLLFSPVSALTFNTSPGLIVVQPEAIVQVICFGIDNKRGPYVRSGTAFRVGGYLLSVNHVTTGPAKCFIGKDPIKIAYASPKADFSMLEGDSGPFLQVDCGGFIKGRKYVALGYARGLSQITPVELTGTGEVQGGLSVLVGMFSVIPGQSGGPVIDEQTGKVVGTVNVENYEEGMSGSVALQGTPVCKGRIA